MIEKQVFFWSLSGVVKPSRSIGFRCRVSGFRLVLAFSLLTPDIRQPKPEGQCPIFTQSAEN
ncbi:MAG: hypothetical protein B6I30_00830 [Desulfobacteraceae bacterium 4572_187]|nr:MAG: hypothetical protein B6I30_00830 [Desulfobacteraceae bacterium 4572_187]